MKFTLAHSRAVMGQNITVAVQASDGEQIVEVAIDLDRFTLADETLDPPTVSYEREFNQAGDAAPDMDHLLEVTTTDSKGRQERATKEWTDPL